ncbi:MAG: hypothetical protein ACRD0W_03800 [Acidimicrobiales bacterium]
MRRTVRATPTKRTVPSCGTRGDRAYLVAADDEETADVDIVDVTDPKHPVFVGDFDLNVYNVSQPELAHTDSFLHDMVVKQIGDRFIMLLSYCDGGWVLLDVTDPAIRSSSATATTHRRPRVPRATGASLTRGKRTPGGVHRGQPVCYRHRRGLRAMPASGHDRRRRSRGAGRPWH